MTGFRDVSQQRRTCSPGHSHKLEGWSPSSNTWDEKNYPAWADGDSRWDKCWKGGKVVARLTSDSPALVGSNVTFVVSLEFPRCQKEDENGDIVYDRSERCRNDLSQLSDVLVYNWTQWLDYSSPGYFPDGKPFPHHHDRRRSNFIYIFQTLGQYSQQIGGSSAVLYLNTTDIPLGTQLMEVSVYRRGRRQHTPVAKASDLYLVTDEIPFYVNLSQKNDRNATDHIFIKDSPISFTVNVHDPSHYLNVSAISYDWNFGDGSGSFVSNSPLTMHTYTLPGNFSVHLTIKAAVPGPCVPVPTTTLPVPTTTLPVPTTEKPMPTTEKPMPTTTLLEPTTANITFVDLEVENLERVVTAPDETTSHSTPAVECVIYSYGYYESNITIVEGLLELSILQRTGAEVTTALVDSDIDFIVTCQGSIPKDACTVVSDATCMVPQGTVCDQVAPTTDECLLTLRRSFSTPGTYCVNISLSDDASLVLGGLMVSVHDGSGSGRTVVAVLVSLGFLAILVTVVAALLVKRYKQYKPIESAGDNAPSEGLGVYFGNMKAVFINRKNESHPLLKTKDGII
ncbi:transmembrane glycoprotein NMB isoform X2 [Pleurodeles waltl]|uniref:transmembrane glycoprotein NMB isoform X2 n=1 Tax=Pleurodeles waltl TaxID=8319 RepID=UPI00370974D1